MRILAGAFMASVVLMTVAVLLVVRGAADIGDDGTPWLAVLGLLGWALVAHLLAETVSYRVSGGPGADPVEQFRAGTVLRLALAQSVAVVGVALAFVVPGRADVVVLFAGAAALLLLALDAFPGSRQVRRTETALRAAGAATDLRQRLGAP